MALATIPLSVELTAKIAGFQRDMQAGVGIAQASAKSIAGAFTAASTAVTALVGTAFVAGIATMVTSSVNAVDSFNDLRDATGASIENISALDRIAREAGGSFDTVATSLVKFNGVLNKTDEDGNAAAAVFKALGLNAEELKKMDPAEALLKAATAFNSFADDGNKARAAQILFGKSLQEIAPFLKDLAEKGKLVATTTAEQAEQAENYNKQIARMKANHEDLVRNIASSVLPTLNNLLEKLQAAGGFTGSIKIRLGLDDQSKAESELAAIQQKADTTKTAIDSMAEALARSPGDDNLVVRLAKAKDRYADLSKQLFVAADRLKAAANAASPLPVVDASDAQSRRVGRVSLNVPEDPKKRTAAPIDQQAKAYAELTSKIREKIAADDLETVTGLKLTDAQKQQLDITKLVADGKIKASDANSAATKSLLAEMAASEAANEQKRLQLAFDQQLRDTAYASATARSKEVGAMVEANAKLAEEIELIGKDEALQRAILRARESSTIAIKSEQLARLDLAGACTIESEALREELGLLRERMALGDSKSSALITEADTKAQKAYTDDLKKDLAGAFSSALQDTGNPIKAFATALAGTVSARLSASIAESLANSALSALDLGAGGGGGWLNSLVSAGVSYFLGGSTPAATSNYSLTTAPNYSGGGMGLKYNAKGGVYSSPSLSAYSNQVHSSPKLFAFAKGAGVFGEAGPEAIMPLTRAANGSLGVRAMGLQGGQGAGITVNVVVENHGTDAAATSTTEQQPDGSALVRVILRAVADDTATGGITARATAQRFALKTA